MVPQPTFFIALDFLCYVQFMWDLDTPSPNSPLTELMVEEAERKLGVRFPADYLEALRIKNGGSVKGNLILLPEQSIPSHLQGYVDHGTISVSVVNGIGSSDTSVLETTYLALEWDLPKELILLDGDGHTWLAFDYRETKDKPSIVFVESDSGDSLHIAEDFTRFFNALVPEEHFFDEDGNFIG